MLLIIVHLLLCLFLVVVILLQPGKSDGGIGFGSSSQTIFGSKGAGNFLTTTTSAFAVAFLLTSLMVTRCEIDRHKPINLEGIPDTTPATPQVPAVPSTDPAAPPAAAPDTKAKAPAPATDTKKAGGGEKKNK